MLISGRRAAMARTICDNIVGSSPLFRNTEARALERALGVRYRSLIAIRY